jgi:hypothetical protein
LVVFAFLQGHRDFSYLKGQSQMTMHTRRAPTPILPFIVDTGRIRMGDCMRITAAQI